MDQIQFRSGQFLKFTAARMFKLGDTGVSINAGDTFQFDGSMVIFEGESPRPLPQLRGVYKAGWIVLSANYDPDDNSASIPQAAPIKVSPATGGNPMDPSSRNRSTMAKTASDEQEVGSIQLSSNGSSKTTSTPARSFNRSTITVEPQEGRVVRAIKTPARQTANLEKETYGEIIARAEVQIEPGKGVSREEILANMPEEERLQYLSEIESRKAGLPGSDRDAKGRKVTTSIEGIKTTLSVGNGSLPVIDLGGSTDDSEVSVTEVEGIKVTNTNGPKAKKASTAEGAKDPRRTIAKSICSDFPDNYVFTDSIKKKIARLQADFEDRPDVIRAVAAAETDAEVKNRLIAEFPSAFGL